MNELVNDGIKLSKLEINIGFINGLPKKWLSLCQSLRNTYHVKDSMLACLFGKLKYEENLIDSIYETKKKKSLVSATPLSTALFSTSIVQDFQDSPDDEEDTRSSSAVQKQLTKLNATNMARRVILSYAKAYEWDEEEVALDDNEMIKVKVLMAFADDENLVCIIEQIPIQKKNILGVDQLTEDPSSSRKKDLVCEKSLANDTKLSIPGVEKPLLFEAERFIMPNHDTGRILPAESQRNTTDPPVVVTNSLATDYDLADESSVYNTPLLSLKKLDGVEPVSGPKTIKSNLKLKSTFKDEALKGVIINEPSPAPAKGNKSTSASKVNLALAVDNINIAKSERYPPDEYLHPYELLKGNPGAGMITRAMAKELSAASACECLFVDFLSKEEPKNVSEALKHPRWVDAMQDELNQFARNKVRTLVLAPYGKNIIGSKWIFRNKRYKIGIVIKNKARLMLKNAFLNGKLKEEVYVKQPPGFESILLAEVSSASALQVLRRLGSIFTLVYAVKIETFVSLIEVKEGETLTQTFTRYKALMNELVNKGAKLSRLEINTGFLNGLPKKWPSFCQSLKNTNHMKDSELASLFGKLKHEENLIDIIYETEKNKSLVFATPLSTAFISTSIVQGFQDSPDDEEDTRRSHEYLNDLEEEYQARALLAKSKRFFKKVLSYQSPFQPKPLSSSQHKPELRPTKDFEAKYNKVKAKLALLSYSASSSKAATIKNKCLIAEAYEWDEEVMLPAESQRNTTDPSVAVNDSSTTKYDSTDESSVCSTPLPPLKMLDGAEHISGPDTTKSIFRSKSTFKAKTLKVVTINEPSSAPAKGNKNSLASKVNSAPAGKLKSVKIEDNPPLAICDIRKPICFHKVAFVNGLKYNLISICQLCDAKYIVQFDEKRGAIFNSNKEFVMIALRVRDVYVLDMTSSAQESCFFAKDFENLN
ncbi:retrovirus-related pol polyprotein from transposon TNT 1-94 [Tanacetum coccineum]